MIGKYEKNDVAIALNYMYEKKQKIYPACVSKNNSNRERQVILSMIPNGGKSKAKSKERWHYLAEKKNCQSY